MLCTRKRDERTNGQARSNMAPICPKSWGHKENRNLSFIKTLHIEQCSLHGRTCTPTPPHHTHKHTHIHTHAHTPQHGLKRNSICQDIWMRSVIPRKIKYIYKLHYDEVLGDFLRPPHVTLVRSQSPQLETRRSRVQPLPTSATFFRGDWSWNIFYGHSLPSADSRRAVVSFWRKNVHNTG